MIRRVFVLPLFAVLLLTPAAAPRAFAQQRPLLTEDPEPIGAGRILVEGGFDYAKGQEFPVSGLKGDLWRIPTIGLSIGISSIAELQIDGGFYNHLSIDRVRPAPLSDMLELDGDSNREVEDVVIGTMIRLLAEAPGRPALGFRFATRLPNAGNESGLGLDTTDFYAAVLGAKTVQSIRLVGNIGFGILGDPARGDRQNDVLTYGASLARALTDRSEVVGELNGRISTRSGPDIPGTESRGVLNLGARYTEGAIRFDGGMFLGLTSVDPTIGFTAGFTYVFNAFQVP